MSSTYDSPMRQAVPVTAVRTVLTADLTDAELAVIRRLLDVAFDDEFGDEDWDHALGGAHLLVSEDGVPVAHGSVVQRRFLHGGRSWRCGYVEAVAVRPDRQRRGLGSAVMAAAERLIDGGYQLGALSTSDEGRGLYLARGWTPWRGATAVLAPSGVTRTEEDDDSTFVREVPGGAALNVTGTLICDWREGDVW
ncbi:GNAT family N-acetyltransferase [Actinoplanes aureus]|uniref:GNAT family N-acetyltransferase n=1 Tax=Actinoplanes aureus TaxID=2792083 RepID=UPI0035A09153